MYYTPLHARGLLRLSGEDAIAFLQGIITSDATRLRKGEAIYAALLTPQGKYLHDFFLYPQGDAIILDGEKARLDDLLARLKLYKLRSKVTIEALPESHGVIAVWGYEDIKHVGLAVDPRLPELGYRLVGELAALEAQCVNYEKAPFDKYDAMRLALGVPDGSRDMIVERSFLLECRFEELHGVDFAKGCYVGQEVTARSKYRGQVKKQLYPVRAVSGSLPPSGTAVFAGEAEIGQMRSHCGVLGMALLRTEAAQELPELKAGDAILSVFLPVKGVE